MLENMKFKLQNNIYNFCEEINETLSSTGYKLDSHSDELAKAMNNKRGNSRCLISYITISAKYRLKQKPEPNNRSMPQSHHQSASGYNVS
jgi:hypothetical protein